MADFRKYTIEFLISESSSLLTRLEEMKPFEMTMPMVKSASVSENALEQVGLLLAKGKGNLQKRINQFISFLECVKKSDEFNEEHLQSYFSALKLRYNQILDQLDIFADVLSQRSEHDTGIWLSGLDSLAEDGLKVGKAYYKAPPIMVFLERGHGAAIRKARTRLPGGDENPVAVIQIPRERMVGYGIASSLIHETGHQGSTLLKLVSSLKPLINRISMESGKNQTAWVCFEKWISEIIADFWAIAQLGVCATIGLMGVVSLPSYFQFRLDLDDPHPAPFVRVQLSCRIGEILFPDLQWKHLWKLWESFYPKERLPQDKLLLLKMIDEEMDRLINLIINHKPSSLLGKKLIDIFEISKRQPEMLRKTFLDWNNDPKVIDQTAPILVFAVMGQAKADQIITPKEEAAFLKRQLNKWAIEK